MPETITEKYASQVKQFVLPPEFREKPESKAEAPKEPEKPVPEVKVDLPQEKAEAVEATAEAPLEEQEQTTEKDPEKATTRRFERRIDRAHKRAAEAQARAELLERELAELKVKSQPQVPSAAPRMEDFTDVQEYVKAYATYEKDQAIKEYEKKQRDAAVQSQQKKLVEHWEAGVSKAQSKYDDWDEVVGDIKPTTPWAYAMMEADNGPDIAHYLGTHPAEVRRIAALTPSSQFREIGKLELKLQAPPEPPKKPSKAPAPIEPVKGDAKISEEDIVDNMDFEKYKRLGDKRFGIGGRKVI